MHGFAPFFAVNHILSKFMHSEDNKKGKNTHKKPEIEGLCHV
jgi:hypothetical protein